ncbi:MAG TPA: hypothetical protein VEC35_20965 [Noviherbaspirillum sp.]|nr:hypothetical protein [Noviherbaspirillum sp.]
MSSTPGKARPDRKGKTSTVRVQPGTAPQRSPLYDIAQEIKRNPALGVRLAIEAGIVTPTGRLTKSYRD